MPRSIGQAEAWLNVWLKHFYFTHASFNGMQKLFPSTSIITVLNNYENSWNLQPRDYLHVSIGQVEFEMTDKANNSITNRYQRTNSVATFEMHKLQKNSSPAEYILSH